MNTIDFKNKGSIRMIAHRGVSGLELENTCPAFVAAGLKINCWTVDTLEDAALMKEAGVDFITSNILE